MLGVSPRKPALVVIIYNQLGLEWKGIYAAEAATKSLYLASGTTLDRYWDCRLADHQAGWQLSANSTPHENPSILNVLEYALSDPQPEKTANVFE